MRFSLRTAALLLLVVIGTRSQDFDLGDALDPEPEKPKKPEDEPAKPPPKPAGDDFGLDLGDALGDLDPVPEKPKTPVDEPAKPPPKPGDDFRLDLGDALGDPDPKPKPTKPPMKVGGGGGSFDDSDLFDIGKGDYKPDAGRGGGGGARAQDPGYNDGGGGGDQPQEAGAGQIAGIASAVGMAILGAASSYFAYQKKKLCFKLQGGADPESGKNYQGDQAQPQQLSNLLKA